jgi:hypothetical protein
VGYCYALRARRGGFWDVYDDAGHLLDRHLTLHTALIRMHLLYYRYY